MSVYDSADVGVEMVGEQSSSEGVVKDAELALRLKQEESELQLLQDAQLAEQLQLKENSYMTPR